MKENKTHLLPRRAGGFIIILYLAFVNIFILKSSLEFLTVQLILIVLLLRVRSIKKFFHDWAGFLVGLFFYTWVRGFVDNISPFYNYTLFAVYRFENFVLGDNVATILRNLFEASKATLLISSILYNVYFFMIFCVPFVIWVYKDTIFKDYVYRFFGLLMFGLLFFFFLPTAPPWFVSNELGLGLPRIFYTQGLNASLVRYEFVRYLISDNLVAALPSFHVAWPVFQIFYLYRKFSKRALYLLFIPIGISFSVAYGAEHYITDILLGAASGIYFAYADFGWLSKKLKHLSFISQL